MFFHRLRTFFLREPVLLSVYALVCGLITAQNYLLPPKQYLPGGAWYTQYNNYLIFKQSFPHLLAGQNLYAAYPQEYWDLFKYAPTFGLAMAPFAVLPDWLGLALWNLLNGLSVFFALKYLPGLSRQTTACIRWFVLLELVTSLQNSQVNALLLALLLGAYLAWERHRPGWATPALVAGAFVKPFVLAGGLLWFFFRGKRRALAAGIGTLVGLALLPAAVVGWPALRAQYENWAVLLESDYASSLGLSVMGWLHTWFGLQPPHAVVIGAGTGLLLLPLLRTGRYLEVAFRRAYLASILIWVVIFNHRAESPTFVIAMAGVGIWYFSKAATRLDTVLVVLTFVFTTLSPTDVFPATWRNEFVVPYVLKAVGCILIWGKITGELLGPQVPEPDLRREQLP